LDALTRLLPRIGLVIEERTTSLQILGQPNPQSGEKHSPGPDHKVIDMQAFYSALV
jgi:hypothetical protein